MSSDTTPNVVVKPNSSAAQGDNKSSDENSRLTPGNWIGLVALSISIFTFIWQAYDAWKGAQVVLMPLDKRVIVFRCSSGNSSKCWDTNQASVSVIAPAFFSNSGANQYNGVIERVEVALSVGGRTLKLQANSVWLLSQFSSGPASRPFGPIVVNGSSSAGHELRFIPFDDNGRKPWLEFALQILKKDLKQIKLVMTAHLALKGRTIIQSCTVVLNDRHRKALQRRLEERKAEYLSTVCFRDKGN